MAATTELRITNNGNSRQFLFRAVSSLSIKKIQPPITIPLVGRPSSAAFQFRFIGQLEEVTFSFALFDDGVDVSNGTNPGVVITVDDQISYLKDTIFSEEFDTDWDLTDFVYSPSFIYNSQKVLIVNLDIPITQGSKNIVVGTMTVQLGALVSL